MSIASPSDPGPDDVMSKLVEYFTHTTTMWDQLTQQLSKGPPIIQAAVEACGGSEAASQISGIDLSRLRQINDLSEAFSRQLQDLCHPQTSKVDGGGQEIIQTSVSASASCGTKMSSVLVATSPRRNIHSSHIASRRLVPDKRQGSHASPSGVVMSGSDDPSDDDEQFASIDMEALRQRGKGTYVCPKGLQCDKGGVDGSGNVVIFGRNSSFVRHCNRHRKPWRCDLPGCPSSLKQRRFARRDALERHQKAVKHYLVS